MYQPGQFRSVKQQAVPIGGASEDDFLVTFPWMDPSSLSTYQPVFVTVKNAQKALQAFNNSALGRGESGTKIND